MRRILVFFALAVCSCSTKNVVQTALHGDLTTLKREIRDEQKRGDLDHDTVKELARAIAGRELRSSQGAIAVKRIRQLSVCAAPLLPVYRDRAARGDDAAAEATLVLFELHKLSAESLVKHYQDSSSGAWRAVAARAATAAKHGEFRRRSLVDPDERVRRAALSAALHAQSRDDLSELLEAARLDPDPLSRGLAARAAGAVGGERAVLGLKDLWARADEPTRITLIDGWAMPRSLRAGGQRELLWAAENTSGLAAIAAADALVRTGGEHKDFGVGLLLRAIRDGTTTERTLALRLAPLSDDDIRKAVEKSSNDADLSVRVIALARLSTTPNVKPSVRVALRKLAKGKDEAAEQARAALAALGDASIAPVLEAQLANHHAQSRRLAAIGLLRLGRYSTAATALADDDPGVRSAVACSVLNH